MRIQLGQRIRLESGKNFFKKDLMGINRSAVALVVYMALSSGSAYGGKPGAGRRVQLHRALSKLGLCSRSVAWQAIKKGRVQVSPHRPLSRIDDRGKHQQPGDDMV